jgi:hypothetical protein
MLPAFLILGASRQARKPQWFTIEVLDSCAKRKNRAHNKFKYHAAAGS